ncbi:MAG: N-acetylmuramic acid 6-phosphate etherase [bacterium]|jgi:N-acetylmuramic acid 6-phosphate etherase
MNLKNTEQDSNYRDIESMSVEHILQSINNEDMVVAKAVSTALPQVAALVKGVVQKMLLGGRLFYIGAGTSGRLGVVDASECPPTFGVDQNLVVGVIAGGNDAMFKALEFAEDDLQQAWKDLSSQQISDADVVIGISASGTTPYVLGGLKACQENRILTGSISCNQDAVISQHADFPIEVLVGPEFITGSTRMKCGTAQKMLLNMISTAVMIQLGRIEDNKMVNMQLTNVKLIERGTEMLMTALDIKSKDIAKELLLRFGSVKKAIEAYRLDNTK